VRRETYTIDEIRQEQEENMGTVFSGQLQELFGDADPPAKDEPAKTTRLKGKDLQAPGTSKIKSRRNDDMSAEAQLGIFLDTYLYSNFPHGASFSRIERIYDKDEQLAGVDVRFTDKDGTVYDVDEKAQLYYLNKDLPTFAFEIQFLREGRETLGWLCNESLLTDLYLLIWPFATQDKPKGIRWDQFTKADCLLVEKKKLLSLLKDEGLTPKKMLEKASQLRKDGHVGKAAIPGVQGIYYYASDPKKYREAPINIVVSKKRLLNIAQRRYIVTKNSVISQ